MIMKKFAIILIATFCSVASWAQELSPDSTFITVKVSGRKMVFPLVSKHDKGMIFATNKAFIEHGVTYLYREYSYYQCDTCSGYQVDTSSYFVRPKSSNGYLQHLHRYTYWMRGAEGTEVYYADAYDHLREKCPTLQHNQLGDIPRMWYPVVKYRGKYYISIDNLTAVELTDSIVVYHDMEIAMFALLNITKVGEDSYAWQEQSAYFEGIDSVTIRPAIGAKGRIQGLYVMTTVRKELGIIVHQLVTPESDIHNFDFIDWRSSDHIPDGLPYDPIDFNKL